MDNYYIIWGKFFRRPDSMADIFCYKIIFFEKKLSYKFLRLIEYIMKYFATTFWLIRNKPKIIWIALAPTPLLYAVYYYKICFNKKLLLIADCHYSMFTNLWLLFPGALFMLNQCEIVIVHNHYSKERALKLGIFDYKLVILEDRPLDLSKIRMQENKLLPALKPNTILFPCSFDSDEPIEIFLKAAHLIPEVNILITGDISKLNKRQKLCPVPNNVKILGFISIFDYNNLILKVDAMLGLTTVEGIQICVANEAVGAEKPLIISNTEILKELFYKGTILVDPLNSESIAQGCRMALLEKDSLAKKMKELKQEREQRWNLQAKDILKLIEKKI